MKILLDHHFPFLLAHGGLQVQIEQTRQSLLDVGLEVEYLRWWDDRQRGDIIHFIGRPDWFYTCQVREKGIKLVITDLLTGTGSRSRWKHWLQKAFNQTARSILPPVLLHRMGWLSYRDADACLFSTSYEADLARFLFDAPAHNQHVVPNGIEAAFITPDLPQNRGPWLVTTASIVPHKRVLETAQAAVQAQTPYWVIGKPMSEKNPYYLRFLELARQHPQFVRYEGPISDRQEVARIYRQSRGFVLLSAKETLSLSSGEAAACRCPLLLSDLPWARTYFGDTANYCPSTHKIEVLVPVLRRFYEQAPQLPPPLQPPSWPEVGQMFKNIYQRVLSTSS